MTVKRYTPTQCCEHDGTYVTYSDYQKLASLAEERREFIVNGVEHDYIELPLFEDDRANAIYQRCLLKDGYATADINAELRAQGVALAISHLSKKFTNLGVPITSLEWLEVDLRAGRNG